MNVQFGSENAISVFIHLFICAYAIHVGSQNIRLKWDWLPTKKMKFRNE